MGTQKRNLYANVNLSVAPKGLVHVYKLSEEERGEVRPYYEALVDGISNYLKKGDSASGETGRTKGVVSRHVHTGLTVAVSRISNALGITDILHGHMAGPEVLRELHAKGELTPYVMRKHHQQLPVAQKRKGHAILQTEHMKSSHEAVVAFNSRPLSLKRHTQRHTTDFLTYPESVLTPPRISARPARPLYIHNPRTCCAPSGPPNRRTLSAQSARK